MHPHRPQPRTSIAGSALTLLVVLTLAGPARADSFFETVYLPTSSVVSVPMSSSVLSTSYVVPSSFSTTFIPTSYTSTYIPTTYSSTYIPTSYSSTYLPTSTILSSDSVLVPTTTTYYRPSIFRSRRFVERTSYSYSPTSYLLSTPALLPTTYVSSSVLRPTSFLIDNGVVTTSLVSSPCDTDSTVSPTRVISKPQSSNSSKGTGSGLVSEPTNASPSTERKPSATYNSLPSDESGKSSDVPPVAPTPAPTPTTPPTPIPAPSTAGTKPETAPLPQPDALQGPDAAKSSAQPAGGVNDPGPVMPAPGTINSQSPKEMQYRYQARRPAGYETRNILRGRVVSAETKLPEEGVTVIISNEAKTFTDRQAMTNSDGEFKISLPDGDWTVKVKMNSGRIFAVGQDYLTASNGRITYASGRNVGEMVIAR